MSIIKQKKGFTLVEVIVVLVILAILAALMVPSMTGWIDKAKEQKYIADARLVYTAAQSAISEQYGINPSFSTGLKFAERATDGTTGNFGRVSSNMLSVVQTGGTTTSQQGVDKAIATQVLKYLDSSDKNTARYKFPTRTGPTQTESVPDYCTNKKQPGVIIVYDGTGTVRWVEFGYDDYLVHIDAKGVQTAKDSDPIYYSLFR